MAGDDVEPVLADFSLYPRRLLLANVGTLGSSPSTPTLFPADDDAIRQVNDEEDTGCLLACHPLFAYWLIVASHFTALRLS